jgi:hypothetical protein
VFAYASVCVCSTVSAHSDMHASQLGCYLSRYLYKSHIVLVMYPRTYVCLCTCRASNGSIYPQGALRVHACMCTCQCIRRQTKIKSSSLHVCVYASMYQYERDMSLSAREARHRTHRIRDMHAYMCECASSAYVCVCVCVCK